MESLKVLELKNASRYYPNGQVHALKDISLNVKKNEYISIIGVSGSGKSTLLNILGCLDVVTSGKYILNGIEVSQLDNDTISSIRNREIGFVFQMFHLLKDHTALENVMLPLLYAGMDMHDAKEKAAVYLEKVEMKDRMNHKPFEMSGGQQQRTAIARALVNEPSIILADEPTGNLDTSTSREIMKLIADIHTTGSTVIYITHEENIAAMASRTIKIRDGEIEYDHLN